MWSTTSKTVLYGYRIVVYVYRTPKNIFNILSLALIHEKHACLWSFDVLSFALCLFVHSYLIAHQVLSISHHTRTRVCDRLVCCFILTVLMAGECLGGERDRIGDGEWANSKDARRGRAVSSKKGKQWEDCGKDINGRGKCRVYSGSIGHCMKSMGEIVHSALSVIADL